MKKRLIYLFLIFALITAFVLPVFAEDITNSTLGENFKYSVNSDGEKTITVTGVKNNLIFTGDVVLPEEIDGFTVTQIGYQAFANQTSMTGFVMPDTVTAISGSVFWACNKLETVELSKNLKGSMGYTFGYCEKLKAVTIPAGVTGFNNTFEACKLLTEIAIPDGAKTIDANTFVNCLALKKIYLPKTITFIAEEVFKWCNTFAMTVYTNDSSSYAAQYAANHNMNCAVVEDDAFLIDNRKVSITNNLPAVTATLHNNKYSGTVKAICVLYETVYSGGSSVFLYDVVVKPTDIGLGDEKEITFNFGKEYKENLTYKIMIYESLKSQRPIISSVERLLVQSDGENYVKKHLNENFGSYTSWDKNMDNTGAGNSVNIEGLYNLMLNDGSDYLPSEAYRSFSRIKGGNIIVDFDFSFDSFMNDSSFRLLDGRNTVFGIVTEGTFLYLEQPDNTKIPLTQYVPSMDRRAAGYYVKAELDFDTGLIKNVRINGSIVAENKPFVCSSDGADGFDFLTGAAATGCMVNRRLNIYSNYVVYEDFYNANGQLPMDWDYTYNGGQILPYTINNCMPDRYSIQFDTKNGGVCAKKHFNRETGCLMFEIMALQPEKRGGVGFSLNSGDKQVIKISSDGENYIYKAIGDMKAFYEYKPNVWYGLKVEIDLINSMARIYVNNKLTADNIKIDANIYAVDSINLDANQNNNSIIIDDIKLYHKKEIPEDYVPIPQISNNEKKFVTGMQTCPLWTEGQFNKAWDTVKSSPGRMPLLGAYDEGNPEVSDWEIKWMTEHGIDYQAICIYPNIHIDKDGTYQPIKPNIVREGNALYEGFMNAKYSDMMKFCIIFENSTLNLGNAHYDEFFDAYVPYWIEYYFKDDRYLKIDGRPIVSIYVMDNFLKMFGSMDGTDDDIIISGINRFRQMCIDAGVGNPYIISHGFGYVETTFAKYSRYGIDCLALYGWPQDIPPTRQKNDLDVMPGYSSTYGIDFVTCVEPRHDEITWDNRTGFHATEEEFRDLLTWIRDNLERRIIPNNLSKKLMMYQTWNEYGEGHIMAPTVEDGFKYLDVVRNVFLGSTEHDDIVPTEAQGERIHRLVNQDRKVTYTTEKSIAEIPTTVKKGWYFNNSSDASCWQAESQVSEITNSNGKLYVKASGNTPTIMPTNALNVDLFDITYIKIRMKNNYSSSGGAVFWTTNSDSVFDNKKRTHFSGPASTNGAICDYYIPVCQNIRWNGKLSNLKLMLGNIRDSSQKFEIESIEFLSDDSITNGAKLKVGDNIYSLATAPLYKNGVLMVPLRTVAEAAGAKVGWYAYDNCYTITRDGITTRFEIGASIGDKKQFPLIIAEPAYGGEIINDTVFVPLKLIKDALNMNIEWDDLGKVITVKLDERNIENADKRTVIAVEKFLGNNLSNINQFTNISFSNGSFFANATGGDANFCMSTFAGISTDDVEFVSVKLYSSVASTLWIYYSTTEDHIINSAKSSSGFAVTPGENIINIPASKISGWSGHTLNLLRIDPICRSGNVEIDYVALLGAKND